jgi:hypothetical protein
VPPLGRPGGRWDGREAAGGCVVDELGDCLRAGGLTAAAQRGGFVLLVGGSSVGAPDPVVLIGTMWPDRYAAYTAVPAPGGADPRWREREVLDLAEVVRIGAEFSPAEQDRA